MALHTVFQVSTEVRNCMDLGTSKASCTSYVFVGQMLLSATFVPERVRLFHRTIFLSSAIRISSLRRLEPHLLQQDEMTVGKLLKNIVACRMQFEQDHTYPIEAYEQTALWRDCKLTFRFA